MALDAGNALAETGLAGALQVATAATFGEFPNEVSRGDTAKFYDMLASTIINYFKANAEIKIKTTDTGLQQYLIGAVPTDTDGPTIIKTLTDVLF
jgi:hypothetical protein